MIKDSRIVNFVIYLIKTIKDILIEEKWYIFKMLFFFTFLVDMLTDLFWKWNIGFSIHHLQS